MARYYFDVLGPQRAERDWLGIDLPSFGSATREAFDRSRLLLEEEALEDEDRRSWIMVARGDDFAVLFALRLSIVLMPEPPVSTRLQ